MTQGTSAPEIRVADASGGWAWIEDGFKSFARTPGPWLGIVVVWWCMAVVINILPAGSLAFYILQPIFWGGLMLGCRAQERGDGLEFRHLFEGFKDQAGSLAALGALNIAATILLAIAMLIVAAVVVLASGIDIVAVVEALEVAEDFNDLQSVPWRPLVIIGCLVMLVGAALGVVVLMAFWFAPVLVVLDKVELFESIRLSLFGCLRNWLAFLVYGVLLSVLSIVATLPMMLGWLVLGPIFAASLYAAYREIYAG